MPGEFEAWIVAVPAGMRPGSGCLVSQIGGSGTFRNESVNPDIDWAALEAILSVSSRSSVVVHSRDAAAVDYLANNAAALRAAKKRDGVGIEHWQQWREVIEAIRRRGALKVNAHLCVGDEHAELFAQILKRIHGRAWLAAAPRAERQLQFQPGDYAPFGDRERYETAVKWARGFYTEEEQRLFNRILSEGGEMAFQAMKAVVSRFEHETGLTAMPLDGP